MIACPYCGISLKVYPAGNSGLYFCYMCGHAFDRDDVTDRKEEKE